jgi:hypothetical protein
MGDGVIDGEDVIERRELNVFTVDFTGSVDTYLKIIWIIEPPIPTINGSELN